MSNVNYALGMEALHKCPGIVTHQFNGYTRIFNSADKRRDVALLVT